MLLRYIVRSHKLLRVDHGKKAVQCFAFNFLRVPDSTRILQVCLRAQFTYITSRLPIYIALLERMEHFFFSMIKRVRILLLIVGRYAIHQCFEGEPIFPLKLKLRFPLKFLSRLVPFALLLGQTLRLKLHETMNRLVVASWGLSLWKLVLCNCTRCRGIRQDNVLILHLAK